MSYFQDTDTLYLELRAGQATETRDLDENTLIDVDASGRVCAITFEHASERTDLERLQIEGIAA
ncbi:MAG: DUF2283 domain-containing protein [Xanthomonadales bacterium]|jgi:uncharacterized protein YuzE|nr:DUF2283 domain-containing protein [Xanthomonadales bacterium]